MSVLPGVHPTRGPSFSLCNCGTRIQVQRIADGWHPVDPAAPLRRSPLQANMCFVGRVARPAWAGR